MKAWLLFTYTAFVLIACKPIAGDPELTYKAEDQQAFELAQTQLDAYNARDIDAFMAVYSDSVKVYRFPDELLMQGHSEMKARYAEMFESTPDLHCLLINRMVQGNTVIDQELVTRERDAPKSQAIAIYKVAAGKIQEVYFISK